MEHALSEVKATLRVSHSALDETYRSSINECLADMEVKGVLMRDLADPNILAAVKLYCQSVHGDPAYSERFMERYRQKRNGLAVAKGYGWGVTPDE